MALIHWTGFFLPEDSSSYIDIGFHQLRASSWNNDWPLASVKRWHRSHIYPHLWLIVSINVYKEEGAYRNYSPQIPNWSRPSMTKMCFSLFFCWLNINFYFIFQRWSYLRICIMTRQLATEKGVSQATQYFIMKSRRLRFPFFLDNRKILI